jgi:hypothetical protein
MGDLGEMEGAGEEAGSCGVFDHLKGLFGSEVGSGGALTEDIEHYSVVFVARTPFTHWVKQRIDRISHEHFDFAIANIVAPLIPIADVDFGRLALHKHVQVLE